MTQFREASGTNWAYGYDALDRMVSVHRNGTLIARYAYDVLGRRIVKRVYSTASGGTPGYLRMVYRGSHVGFETDSIADSIGLTYTWGAGTDQLLAITDGATHYYATTDRLGSVRSLAKRDGTWALTQRFSPYGIRMSRDTSASFGLGLRLRYGWTGREWDQETGFSYHRARYLLPTIRRWTQEDPIGYGGGTNVNAYVGGASLEARDPNGLERENVQQGFAGFCTASGTCMNSLGTVAYGQEVMIDGVYSGSGGGIVASVGIEGISHPERDFISSVWKSQTSGLVFRGTQARELGIDYRNARYALERRAAAGNRAASDVLRGLLWIENSDNLTIIQNGNRIRQHTGTMGSVNTGQHYKGLIIINRDNILANPASYSVATTMIHELGHNYVWQRTGVIGKNPLSDATSVGWENAMREAAGYTCMRPSHDHIVPLTGC